MTMRTERDGTRYYTLPSGVEVPSVTTVLSVIAKPALIPWANKEGRRAFADHLRPFVGQTLTEAMLDDGVEKARRQPDATRDAAADLGTAVHDAVSRWLKEGKVIFEWETPLQVKRAWREFTFWWRDQGLSVVASEAFVYSEHLGYAGTVDIVARHPEGHLVIADLKTGKGIYPEAGYQMAAYARCWAEMHGEAVGEAWGIHLPATAEVPAVTMYRVAEPQRAFDTFLAALEVWRGLREPVWMEA